MRPLYIKAKNPMTIKIKKFMSGRKWLLRYEFILHKVWRLEGQGNGGGWKLDMEF
jgi:hypothetical protein